MIKYLNKFFILNDKKETKDHNHQNNNKKAKDNNNNNKKFNLTQKNHDSLPNHISKPFIPLTTILPSSSTSQVS